MMGSPAPASPSPSTAPASAPSGPGSSTCLRAAPLNPSASSQARCAPLSGTSADHRSLRANQIGTDLRFASGASSTAAEPSTCLGFSRETMAVSSCLELDERLPLGHEALLLHQPSADAARLFGAHGYVHLHGLDDGDLGVGLDPVASLDQPAQQLPGDRRVDVTFHRQRRPWSSLVESTMPRRSAQAEEARASGRPQGARRDPQVERLSALAAAAQRPAQGAAPAQAATCASAGSRST